MNTKYFLFIERRYLNDSTSNLINYNIDVLEIFINPDNKSINIRVPVIAYNLVELLVKDLESNWGVNQDNIQVDIESYSATVL